MTSQQRRRKKQQQQKLIEAQRKRKVMMQRQNDIFCAKLGRMMDLPNHCNPADIRHLLANCHQNEKYANLVIPQCAYCEQIVINTHPDSGFQFDQEYDNAEFVHVSFFLGGSGPRGKRRITFGDWLISSLSMVSVELHRYCALGQVNPKREAFPVPSIFTIQEWAA